MCIFSQNIHYINELWLKNYFLHILHFSFMYNCICMYFLQQNNQYLKISELCRSISHRFKFHRSISHRSISHRQRCLLKKFIPGIPPPLDRAPLNINKKKKFPFLCLNILLIFLQKVISYCPHSSPVQQIFLIFPPRFANNFPEAFREEQ
jgi:hypothetical protein